MNMGNGLLPVRQRMRQKNISGNRRNDIDETEQGRYCYCKIKQYTKVQFLHWTEEEFPCRFRKMLTLEQYRDPDMAELYQNYLAKGPVAYIEKIFAGLTKNDKDARQLALEFYGPIFLLYSLYDGTDEKQDVTKMVEQHVERFSKRLEDTEESSKRD